MRIFLRIIKWGGVPVSIAFWVIGTYQSAQEAAMWLLPTWLWLSLGFTVFVASAFSIVYKLWQENRFLRKKPEVELIYNEKYKPCKSEIETFGIDDYVATKTVYRVGVRVVGNAPAEDVEVLSLSLRRVSEEEQPQLASPLILRPMHVSVGESHNLTVNPGQVPAYYIDVLEHPDKSSVIQLCYHVGSREYVQLDTGRYNYSLLVRARNTQESVKVLVLTLDTNLNLSVTMMDAVR